MIANCSFMQAVNASCPSLQQGSAQQRKAA